MNLDTEKSLNIMFFLENWQRAPEKWKHHLQKLSKVFPLKIGLNCTLRWPAMQNKHSKKTYNMEIYTKLRLLNNKKEYVLKDKLLFLKGIQAVGLSHTKAHQLSNNYHINSCIFYVNCHKCPSVIPLHILKFIPEIYCKGKRYLKVGESSPDISRFYSLYSNKFIGCSLTDNIVVYNDLKC